MHDAITKAIAAHSTWKVRLRAAITTGEVPDTAVARKDNACDFGKWLASLDANVKSTPIAAQVRDAHAAFHVAAADVLDHVRAKRVKEAEASMALQGAFTTASTRLTHLMLKWKQAV